MVVPLQPLIYTEYPGLTPEGAAVREQRLMRELLQEGGDYRPWGSFPVALPDTSRRSLSSPELLGKAIVEAWVTRNERLWEESFVSRQAYSELVHVSLSEAAEFVDNQIGKSLPLWEQFSDTHASEIQAEGLEELLVFEAIELGQGRTLDGAIAAEPEDVIQYWGNRLMVRHIQDDVTFELQVPRIFRLVQEDVSTLAVASEIEAGAMLQTFLDAGLHLRAELLRAHEYPYPLEVGNFWRFRRYDADRGEEESDPLERGIEMAQSELSATEVILEVQQISQYGALRLVHMLRSYNDQSLTREQKWWLLTPRRIYVCDHNCRDKIEDMQWLLSYFQNQVPIFVFPLRLAQGWARGGHSVVEDPVFRTEARWHHVHGPAGTFPATYAIVDESASQTRYFTPGRGVVRRRLRDDVSDHNSIEIIEELVEYRITR